MKQRIFFITLFISITSSAMAARIDVTSAAARGTAGTGTATTAATTPVRPGGAVGAVRTVGATNPGAGIVRPQSGITTPGANTAPMNNGVVRQQYPANNSAVRTNAAVTTPGAATNSATNSPTIQMTDQVKDIIDVGAQTAISVGVSEIMSGTAAQNADDAGAMDMAAYEKTFICRVGDTSVKYGESHTLPVPSADFAALRAEYMELTADLKARKEALGMAPGIESEIIYDSKDVDLYDFVATEKEEGIFDTAAMRVAENENGDGAAKQVKDGLITAGVGVLADILPDMIVGTANEKIKDAKNNKKESASKPNTPTNTKPNTAATTKPAAPTTPNAATTPNTPKANGVVTPAAPTTPNVTNPRSTATNTSSAAPGVKSVGAAPVNPVTPAVAVPAKPASPTGAGPNSNIKTPATPNTKDKK